MALDHLARAQAVHRAAVRALAAAFMGGVDEHARMVIPQGHLRIGAIGGQVLGGQFDDSQWLAGRGGGYFAHEWVPCKAASGVTNLRKALSSASTN